MHSICTVKSESYREKTVLLCKCNKIFTRKEAIFMQCENTGHKNYSIFVNFSYNMKLMVYNVPLREPSKLQEMTVKGTMHYNGASNSVYQYL